MSCSEDNAQKRYSFESIPFRPVPFEDEALTSYIQRVAEANYMHPYQLWRSLPYNDERYPRSGMSTIIDLAPSTMFDVAAFSFVLHLSISTIRKMTFSPLLSGLLNCKEERKILSSKKIPRLIFYKRRFCPLCISKEPYYKLIWQLKPITYCIKHNIRLIDKCSNCGSPVKILETYSKIGRCDHCCSKLWNCDPEKVDVSIQDIFTYNNWVSLLLTANRTLPFSLQILQKYIPSELLDSTFNNPENGLYITKLMKMLEHSENLEITNLYILMNILVNNGISLKPYLLENKQN